MGACACRWETSETSHTLGSSLPSPGTLISRHCAGDLLRLRSALKESRRRWCCNLLTCLGMDLQLSTAALNGNLCDRLTTGTKTIIPEKRWVVQDHRGPPGGAAGGSGAVSCRGRTAWWSRSLLGVTALAGWPCGVAALSPGKSGAGWRRRLGFRRLRAGRWANRGTTFGKSCHKIVHTRRIFMPATSIPPCGIAD